MANQVYANNASAVLASGITDSATTITVASGQGASFPTVSGGNWAYITLVDTSGNLEIVKCTSHSAAADTFTCTRGQDGTTARAFSANDLFELRVTKATLDTLRDVMSATSGSASGLDSITFATSSSGPCLITSSTGSTRKILSNSGSGSYYAMGTSPYVMFKTGISFTENTSAEPGTLVFSMSATSVSCSAPTFTAQAITASNAVTGTRFIPSGSTVPTNGLYLPTTNTIGWATNSTEAARIDSNQRLLVGVTSATTNGGNIETSNGITFPVTQSACSNANTLDDYREATFGMTTSVSDFSGTPPSGTAAFVRIGNLVSMVLPSLSGTSISTAFVVSGVPTTARPASGRNVLVRASDNGGSIIVGLASINTDGTINFYPTQAAGNWTASGTKSINTSNITYII